ncbi:MAG: 16S rRNA (cytosine(1402)-N(4))-methyltransferase, partial [Clostridia bacterium]|nr:16S rRNA (cytosine(1402)-N(4))-methyltransferase [Clostridia bacterium]
ELEGLEKTLEDIYDCLNPGGVAAIITFHSLEDRMVKQYFKKMSEGCTCPKSFPVCVCGNKPKLELMRGRSKTPTEEEIRNNSRSKSARLRAARRIL